jgi:hypothetical protein
MRRKNETIAKVFSTVPLNVSFRRAEDKLSKWLNLVAEVAGHELRDQNDIFIWKLNRCNEFTVKSMYIEIMHDEGVPSLCASWKIRVSLKNKVFMWYLKKEVNLTKDNYARRRWRGSTKCKCYSCNSNVTIQHLFFEYHMTRFIWNDVLLLFWYSTTY